METAYEKALRESQGDVKQAKAYIGKATMRDVIATFLEWVEDADLDDLAGVIGNASGTFIEVVGGEDDEVHVFESEDGYCGMFDEVIKAEALAVCGACEYRSGESVFQVDDDLKCPICGSASVTVTKVTA